jgi:hypothetical protein
MARCSGVAESALVSYPAFTPHSHMAERKQEAIPRALAWYTKYSRLPCAVGPITRLEDEDLRCRVSQIWSHWITSRTDKTTSSPNSYAKKIILRLPNATYNLSSYRIMSSSHIVPQTQAVLIAICFTPSINNNAEQVRLRRVVTRTRPIRLQVDGSLHSLAL